MFYYCLQPQHFSGRAHVNRPPPLSLHQTYYRDTLTQSTTHHYGEPQQSPHCIPASPHHVQSPLVSHSPHVESTTQRVPQSPHMQQTAHILHRQSSAPHLVQSPHLAHSPHFNNFTAGEMSPRPTPGRRFCLFTWQCICLVECCNVCLLYVSTVRWWWYNVHF